MMLGDFGYGLVSLLIALALMAKFKNTILEPVAKVWAYASIPTLFFGIVYDEFFGFRHSQLLGFRLYEGVPRMENINLLLVLTILIGVGHLTLGFFLAALNKFRKREWLHMVAKFGWIAVELSGILLVVTLVFHILPEGVAIPAAVLGVMGLIPIVKAEGITSIIEIPGLASNILSYARILAVGIASVVVAELINELLMPKPSQGLLMLVFIPIYVVLHMFNIVLGMFEALVQGARLNYVEFFSKFYEGGGKRFNPFSYVKQTTA
jgi:V/A-type H+-transporting ATPase subunit I